MSKNYDLIATVDIDIANPIVDDTSFDNLLLVGPLPSAAPEEAPPMVGVYANLDEVTEAGWSLTAKDPIAVAAQVAFSQSPRPSKIYIAPIQVVEGTGDDGDAPESAPESAVETLTRAMEEPGWYVACAAGVDSSEYQDIAEYIEAHEKMFVYTDLDYLTSNTNAVTGTFYRTAGVYGRVSKNQISSDIPESNKYINVAFVAKWLNYPSGSETAAFKMLSAVTVSNLTSTQMNALAQANLNYFIQVGNRNVTMNGKTIGGEWCDVIRFRDWLKNDMQVRVCSLFTMNAKVPYTDHGIALVHNQMLASLKYGQDVGGIAIDEFDADGNRIPGFATSVPLASSLSSSQRASRRLIDCKFKARLAGAIHFAEIKGSLTYEL